jgi:hypothetical protein
LCSWGLASDQPDLYQSKLVVFRSVSKFLCVALSSFTPDGDEDLASTSSNPTWCFSSAFPEPTAYETFDALFRPTINLPPHSQPPVRRWKAEVDPEDDAEHFALDCRSKKLESVDASYSLQDLHNVISSTTLDDLDLDTKLASRQSDFKMVCPVYSCDYLAYNGLHIAFGVGIASGSSVQFPRFSTFCLHAELHAASDRAGYCSGRSRYISQSVQCIATRSKGMD